MKRLLCFAGLWLVSIGAVASAADKPAKPPVYLWYEPEWFEGVQGRFRYWTGKFEKKGAWGIAGPGISAEWTQGGESEWNSMGVGPDEDHASCNRDLIIPRAGKYKLWVRYVDHRNKIEPFSVKLSQGATTPIAGELGVKPAVAPNDEYQLYWGFSFVWAGITGDLAAGPAKLALEITRPGDAWRQVDSVLITDDLDYTPIGREKPPFGYLDGFKLETAGVNWRGAGKQFQSGTSLRRLPLAGRDFSMWAGVEIDPKWWQAQKIESLTLGDVFFQFSPHPDIREKFHQQFAGRRDLPVMSWKGLLPGFYLGHTPDLSPNQPIRKWLERTKLPFYIMTNYAFPKYKDDAGKETYAALIGPLADQFLGYIHGEALGTLGVNHVHEKLGDTRRAHVDALARTWVKEQAEMWKKFYGTDVPAKHWNKGIPCMSVDSIALSHLFHESGRSVIGYEEDATNIHIPMRIAFQRGAARQYGGAWINYASGNFGDACNYFTQNPQVPRGAKAWFHSKYAITDGVSIAWYRKMYYLNYFGGASAIYWEQKLLNQWILPGPGTHPIDLSPYGRATEDFQACVDRLPDRGEPMTPVALLLSYGHAYERVNNACKMLNVFQEDKNDLELRELFNVCWYPTGVLEGEPQMPDVQSLPSGRYGNIFDILVDRPKRAQAVFDYPIVWAAGDVNLTGEWLPMIRKYLEQGGTLVVNSTVANQLPADLLGLKLTGKSSIASQWTPGTSGTAVPTVPFEVAGVELSGAKPIATAEGQPLITRHEVGKGAVIATLVPYLIGQDERAHPSLSYLMEGLTSKLLPVEVRLPNGERPQGEIMYQINRTKDGYVVLLVNNRGIDKTQNGVARVDRRAVADVVLHTGLKLKSAKEYTDPHDLKIEAGPAASTIKLQVHPGDVQVISLVVAP